MVTSQWVDDSYVNEKGVITRGNKNPKNPPTQEEIRWLSAITYLEAGNQSYYGKKCVASVVMNRVNSKRFPNTIKGVLFQSGQFTPGREWYIIQPVLQQTIHSDPVCESSKVCAGAWICAERILLF